MTAAESDVEQPASALTEGPDPGGRAVPVSWLGAEAPGGLTLPSALPTSSQLYGPRGVWLDNDRLIVADTGNHRVMIWHDIGPEIGAHQSADVVLGQPDFATEGAQAGGRGPEAGFRLPTGVLVHDERLVVADAWNHRVLCWDEVPTRSDTAPDLVVGQRDATSVEENRGVGCGPLGFYWPFGIAMVDGCPYRRHGAHRRVSAWPGLPEHDQEPELILGQSSATERDENRGQLSASSFRWPHDIAASNDILFVADAGNHRLLGWKPRPEGDRAADTVLGQPDFTTGTEFPYQPQTAAALRFPYAVDIEHDVMAVADTANNRVLLWDQVPVDSRQPAHRVLGQPSFAVNGENRWDQVGPDTFCWPYGLSLNGDRLAVADSGNNRVTIWTL